MLKLQTERQKGYACSEYSVTIWYIWKRILGHSTNIYYSQACVLFLRMLLLPTRLAENNVLQRGASCHPWDYAKPVMHDNSSELHAQEVEILLVTAPFLQSLVRTLHCFQILWYLVCITGYGSGEIWKQEKRTNDQTNFPFIVTFFKFILSSFLTGWPRDPVWDISSQENGRKRWMKELIECYGMEHQEMNHARRIRAQAIHNREDNLASLWHEA